MTLFDDDLTPTAVESVADPALAGPLVRIKMLVAYDGSAFRGFAPHPDVQTVGATLARTLERVLQVPAIELTCAGRTDAGVHAWGQVVSFDIPVAALEPLRRRRALAAGRGVPAGGAWAELDPHAHRARLDEIQQAVNRLCGPTVVVRAVDLTEPGFDARFSATSRLYRYTIVNRPWPDPFLSGVAWHVMAPLDLTVMTLACDPFIGLHDFSSFCRRPKVSPGVEPVPLTRRVLSARWEDAGDGILYFWIEATAFCHQMVRSITGTIVEVGRGKKKAGEIRGILEARDRFVAGDLAPPHGLCLWQVRY